MAIVCQSVGAETERTIVRTSEPGVNAGVISTYESGETPGRSEIVGSPTYPEVVSAIATLNATRPAWLRTWKRANDRPFGDSRDNAAKPDVTVVGVVKDDARALGASVTAIADSSADVARP